MATKHDIELLRAMHTITRAAYAKAVRDHWEEDGMPAEPTEQDFAEWADDHESCEGLWQAFHETMQFAWQDGWLRWDNERPLKVASVDFTLDGNGEEQTSVLFRYAGRLPKTLDGDGAGSRLYEALYGDHCPQLYRVELFDESDDEREWWEGYDTRAEDIAAWPTFHFRADKTFYVTK